MATRAEIRAKLGIKTIEHPDVANKELTEEESKEYENFLIGLREWHKEIDENIKNYCSRCKYYKTENATKKCDSWIHGCSYGVSCKYIGKAKGEDMSRYANRRKIDL